MGVPVIMGAGGLLGARLLHGWSVAPVVSMGDRETRPDSKTRRWRAGFPRPCSTSNSSPGAAEGRGTGPRRGGYEPAPRRGARGAVGGDLGLIRLGDLLPGIRLPPGLLRGCRRGSFVTNPCHMAASKSQEV